MPSRIHLSRLMLRSLSREVSTVMLRCKADQTQITSVSTQEAMRSHVPRKLGAEYHATSGSEAAEATFRAKSNKVQEGSISTCVVDGRDSRGKREERV